MFWNICLLMYKLSEFKDTKYLIWGFSQNWTLKRYQFVMHIFSIYVFFINICFFMRFLKTYLFEYILHLSILNHVNPKEVQSNSILLM